MSSSSDGPAPLDRKTVLTALDKVSDPKSGLGLVAAGLVQGLAIGPGRIGFMIEISPADAAIYEPVAAAAEAALKALPGVERAAVVLTGEGGKAPAPPSGRAAPPAATEFAPTVRVRRGGGVRISDDAKAQGGPEPHQPPPLKPDHVGLMLAVASGKGGVGKSTVSVNLACAFAALGYRVGLMDADVYGPSAPRMFGIEGEPEIGPGGKLVPIEAWGVKVMSIGFIVDEGAPMIWRGPMASSAVNQFLRDVAWGSEAEPLDILVIDMPPGTGDIQLTLVQRTALAGAVLVSTPQEVALIDVRRGAAMFEKTGVPILGVIENMAYFTNPATGEPIEIFGRGGARQTAADLGAPFLGEIPIEVALREACDDGKPLVATQPDTPAARAFIAAATTLAASLMAGDTAKPAPKIVFED